MTQIERSTQRPWKYFVGLAIGAGTMALAYWYRRPIDTWNVHESPDAEPSRIRQFLPEAEFAGEVTTTIHASPQAIYEAIQSVRLNDMPIAKWVGQVRYLPKTLLGSTAPAGGFVEEMADAESTATLPFLELLQEEAGNLILADETGREVVVGAIGKFHNLADQQFVPLLSPAEFVEFSDPDYQKLAMSFRIVPLPDRNVCRLEFVHGTHALSQKSRMLFALYWLGIKPGGNFVSWLMLRAIKSIAERASQPAEVAASEKQLEH